MTPWGKAVLLLASFLTAQSQSPGHAVFQARRMDLAETLGVVGIPLVRVNGSTGPLEAIVTVDTAASTVQPQDYTFLDGSIRWTDGDDAPKAVVLTLHDDEIFEHTQVLELIVSDDNPSSIQSPRLKIYLLADDDGGRIEFTHVSMQPVNQGSTTNLANDVVTLDEGPPPALECLVWAERVHGSSGPERLELSICMPTEDTANFASLGVDYDFHGSTEPVQWDDGEHYRRCILFNLPAGHDAQSLLPWQSAIRVWPDADEEEAEELCFEVRELNRSTATLDTGILRFVLSDRGSGGPTTNCFLGSDCDVDFTGYHWEPDVNTSLSLFCNSYACTSWQWPYATDFRFRIPAEDLARRDPGDWYACRCFPPVDGSDETASQAVHVITIKGPWSRNVASCTLGWSDCSVQISGEGLRTLGSNNQVMRILHSCAELNDSDSEDHYIDAGLWKGGLATLNTSLNPGAWYTVSDALAMNSAGPGLFYMCWCFSGEGGQASCEEYTDFVVEAGLFVMEGPHVQEDLTIIHGNALEFNITGAGLVANDKLAIMNSSCASLVTVLDTTTTDGYFFNFGTVVESQLAPGDFVFCWCRKATDASGTNCSHPDHWTYVGSLTVMCPSGYYAWRDPKEPWKECGTCWWPWDVPNTYRTDCETDLVRVAGLLVMFLLTTTAGCLILCQLELKKRKGWGWLIVGRRIRIEDVSPEGEGTKLVLTSLGQHHLRKGCSFPLTFFDTDHFMLDNYTHRALVLDRFRMEITRSSGDFFVADASKGHVMLTISSTFWYTQFFEVCPVVPFIFLLFAFGFACVSFGQPPAEFASVVAVIQISCAFTGRLVVWKRQQYSSPLDRRLRQYNAILNEKNPKPCACPRGAQRAVTAFQLFDLYDFFQAFIKGRNMYYIDPNLVRPLTKRYKLSFAERAGPSEVDYFISHWWGTPFVNFCESVRRHAIHMSHSEDEGQWKKIAYWICTFSNNQYKVKEELGMTHQESSFYMALHSKKCKGTAMIMDEEASLLKRSWCLFELLQTVRLTQNAQDAVVPVESENSEIPKSPRFAGMFFCTKTGVLNYGHATVELAMNIGENIKNLSLENATATSQEDKDMINRLVLEEMGSYDKINHILRENLADALRKCQEEVDGKFEGLFWDLKGEVCEVRLELPVPAH